MTEEAIEIESCRHFLTPRLGPRQCYPCLFVLTQLADEWCTARGYTSVVNFDQTVRILSSNSSSISPDFFEYYYHTRKPTELQKLPPAENRGFLPENETNNSSRRCPTVYPAECIPTESEHGLIRMVLESLIPAWPVLLILLGMFTLLTAANLLSIKVFNRLRCKARSKVAARSMFVYQIYLIYLDNVSILSGLLNVTIWDLTMLKRAGIRCFSDSYFYGISLPYTVYKTVSLASQIVQIYQCRDRIEAIRFPLENKARNVQKTARKYVAAALIVSFVIVWSGEKIRSRKLLQRRIRPTVWTADGTYEEQYWNFSTKTFYSDFADSFCGHTLMYTAHNCLPVIQKPMKNSRVPRPKLLEKEAEQRQNNNNRLASAKIIGYTGRPNGLYGTEEAGCLQEMSHNWLVLAFILAMLIADGILVAHSVRLVQTYRKYSSEKSWTNGMTAETRRVRRLEERRRAVSNRQNRSVISQQQPPVENNNSQGTSDLDDNKLTKEADGQMLKQENNDTRKMAKILKLTTDTRGNQNRKVSNIHHVGFDNLALPPSTALKSNEPPHLSPLTYQNSPLTPSSAYDENQAGSSTSAYNHHEHRKKPSQSGGIMDATMNVSSVGPPLKRIREDEISPLNNESSRPNRVRKNFEGSREGGRRLVSSKTVTVVTVASCILLLIQTLFLVSSIIAWDVVYYFPYRRTLTDAAILLDNLTAAVSIVQFISHFLLNFIFSHSFRIEFKRLVFMCFKR